MGFWERRLGGHVSFWGHRVTIFGWNAMHVAINIRAFGIYWCIHPTIRCFGHWWPWYFYISPNATPWAAWLRIGPGVERPRGLVRLQERATGGET